jgi:hypothetical protein
MFDMPQTDKPRLCETPLHKGIGAPDKGTGRGTGGPMLPHLLRPPIS